MFWRRRARPTRKRITCHVSCKDQKPKSSNASLLHMNCCSMQIIESSKARTLKDSKNIRAHTCMHAHTYI